MYPRIVVTEFQFLDSSPVSSLSALASSSKRTTSSCPLEDAAWLGVVPAALARFWSARAWAAVRVLVLLLLLLLSLLLVFLLVTHMLTITSIRLDTMNIAFHERVEMGPYCILFFRLSCHRTQMYEGNHTVSFSEDVTIT